jgi:cyclic-di-GMP phosphodiesterase TipF (flagellum assembly factor)
VLTPAAGSAVAGVDALPATLSPQATAPKRPEPPPIPPLIAALPVESAEVKPDLASDTNADAKPDATPNDTKPVESAPLASAPLDPALSAPAAATSAAAEPSAAGGVSSETTPIAPAPADAPAVAPASTRIQAGRFKDMEPADVIEKIREAVEANRVDLFLQPIVTLPQRKVRYYEAVARLRVGDGDPLMGADFLSHAERGGLMPKIDNLMMFRCVQVVRRLLAKNREIGLFCNLSASTLVDAETFGQFSEFMEANKAIAPALVFEFTQSAARAMGPIENESLAALRERGYRFSLDNVTDLRIEPRDLAERGFRFLKVQSSLLLNRTGVALSDIHPQDFASLLSRYGIELIAARIESEAAVVDLLDYDVKLAQGFLFSPPRPVRPEVVQGAQDRADAGARDKIDGPPPASEAAAAAQRISLAQLARGVVARS